MGYWDDEFYDEPSEFDEKVDEFKKSLLNSVKAEYKEKMLKLEKENAGLQETKNNMAEIKNEYFKKMQELEGQKRIVRSTRLSELLKDLLVTVYSTKAKYGYSDKCEKCDGNRQVSFISPLGKEMKEDCACKISTVTYIPQENVLISFRVNSDSTFYAWYDYKEREDYHSSTGCKHLYDGQVEYDKIDEYGTFFKTAEDCQRYCDWLNKKQ